MTSSIAADRPIIVCALEYERAALLRAGLDELADLQCCGPGAAHIHAWASGVGTATSTVMLCGLAGALSPDRRPGTAHVIDEVRDERGARWQPSLVRAATSHDRCMIISTSRIITTPAAKAELAARTGADLVDLESAAFADSAVKLGWNWAIVRGVSDGADEFLPDGIEEWVDAAGRTRVAVVALAFLQRPALAPTLWRTACAGRAAMADAALLVRNLLECETRTR